MIINERPYNYKIKFEGQLEVTDTKYNTEIRPFKCEVLLGCNSALNPNNMSVLLSIGSFVKPIESTLTKCAARAMRLQAGIEKKWFGLVVRPTKETRFITYLALQRHSKLEEISREEYMSKAWTATSKARCHYKEVCVSDSFDLWCDHIVEGVDIGKKIQTKTPGQNPHGFKQVWETYLADCKNNRPKR